MAAYTVGSLFSGYGGLDLGVTGALGPGGDMLFVSDVEKGPCAILAHRFPDAPNIGDITRVDWRDVPRVDVLCGGSPCTDLSTAGARAGMTKDTRSGTVGVHVPRRSGTTPAPRGVGECARCNKCESL